jgi:hypothetical protein
VEIDDYKQSEYYAKVYHPASTINIKGYFLDYSRDNVKMQVMNADNNIIILYSGDCYV